MNMLAFIVSLIAMIVIGHVTATSFGFGSSYLPSQSYPSSGLWSGGWGGGYSHGSGFGGLKFHSSYGYLPKGVQKPVPVSLEGGYGDENGFGNGGFIVVLVLLLVLFRLIRTYWMPTASESGVVIFG